MMNNILISGAGIAGLCLARQLKKHGISYTLIEKKSQLDATGAGIALPGGSGMENDHWVQSGNLLTLEIDDIAQLTNKII